MKITVWGCRGSLPVPGRSTLKYGGNTTCLEVRLDSGQVIILDAGTGIRSLGKKLAAEKNLREIFLILTHSHWDHLMGFPFFTPIFIPSTRLKIYGPVTYEDEGLDRIIGDQLTYRYFPVKHSELAADITYHPLKESSMDLGDGLQVTTKYLNHPILCLGYRFEHEGKVFCTAYDNEPFRNVFPTDPDDPGYDEVAAEEGDIAAREENEKILQFYKNADILVHDTQYTNDEYVDSKLGWGHTPYEFAINSAHKAGVKKLVLFHHDPMRTDDQLTGLLEQYKELIAGKTEMEIVMASEGMVLEL